MADAATVRGTFELTFEGNLFTLKLECDGEPQPPLWSRTYCKQLTMEHRAGNPAYVGTQLYCGQIGPPLTADQLEMLRWLTRASLEQVAAQEQEARKLGIYEPTRSRAELERLLAVLG